MIVPAMHRFLLVFCFPLVLVACADGPPESAGPPPVREATPSDTVAQDQIEYALEKSPGAPAAAPLVQDGSPADPAPAKRPKTVAPPPPTNTAPAAAPPTAPPVRTHSTAPDHQQWNALLSAHVSPGGHVDYLALQRKEAKLDAYLDVLAKKRPDSSWSREEGLAYWINAYNAYTIKLILNNWPVKSIRDIEDPWDQQWIKLEGKTYSLNQIEHEVIRPTYREARIHFALVCAAVSCPPLANQAYTAQNLDDLLERRTRKFVNDEQFNVTQEAVVRVSPLFDWYKEDFGDVKGFINGYLRTDIPTSKELHFLEYDWALND